MENTALINKLSKELNEEIKRIDHDDSEYDKDVEDKINKKKNKIIREIADMPIEDIREFLGGCKVHCFVNQKGGVAKTVSTTNIAYILAEKGFKVLVIDTDSQASTSGLCNVLPNDYSNEDGDYVPGLQDIYRIYLENNYTVPWNIIQECIIRPQYSELKRVETDEKGKYDIIQEKKDFGFDLIPSDIALSGYEIELARLNSGGFTLYNITKTIKENSDYDFILIDCPPALTMLSLCGIAASVDAAIIPINLEVMTLRGTNNVLDQIIEVQQHAAEHNIVHKGVLGMIKSQYARRLTIQKSFEDVVRDFFPVRTFDTTIPNMTACDKAHARGLLFSQLEKRAHNAFEGLANEIIALDIIRSSETETEMVQNISKEAEEKLYKMQ